MDRHKFIYQPSQPKESISQVRNPPGDFTGGPVVGNLPANTGRVQSLVREDRTRCGVTRPMQQNLAAQGPLTSSSSAFEVEGHHCFTFLLRAPLSQKILLPIPLFYLYLNISSSSFLSFLHPVILSIFPASMRRACTHS